MRRLLLAGFLALAGCNGSGGAGGIIEADPQLPSPPAIQTSVLPRGEIGAAYTEQLVGTTPAGTGSITWSLAPSSSALPGGVTLSSTGLLSGAPAQAGLFELQVRAENAAGGVAVLPLDLIVYENLFYSYTPDLLDTPSNDDATTATPLGVLGMGGPLVQPGPLAVTSYPGAPDVDWFAFTTPLRGDIHVEVFFAGVVGKLITTLQSDHSGVLESKASGVVGSGGDDCYLTLHDAPGGTWYLKVEAQYKNLTWYANAYAFRITFNDLTIANDLVELDVSALQPAQLQGFYAGMPVGNGTWSLVSGALQPGLTLGSDGLVSGTPTQLGLQRATVALEVNGLRTERKLAVRAYDSGAGDYWQRFGEHRYYDSTAAGGNGAHHELYCEAAVVAPHPDYNGEGAIYLIGGRETDTLATVYVFHTAHQANPDREYKLEDIGRPLGTERQYLGATYLQHTYGGYLYVVGGELYSNTAPSSGNYTRVVERLQVADGSGAALPSPGTWQTLSELPADDAGRAIEGWAEFGLVASDAASDADDRLYLAGGRLRIEDAPGSTVYQYEYNTAVLMYEAPVAAVGAGAWYVKQDVAPYTPRRMPMTGMINGRIYLVGGRAPSGVANYIEMYEPDSTGTNGALSQAGPSGLPVLAEAVWYGGCAVYNGALYVLNGWKLQGYAPVATTRLQRFTPDSSGTGGVVDQLTAPDDASGYHSAVFHDGRLWLITGRDSFSPTPRYSLRYQP